MPLNHGNILHLQKAKVDAMIKLEIEKSPLLVAKKASLFYQELLAQKPNAVLGLATGSTPILLYKELVKLYEKKVIDFSQAICFNLDEYCHIPKEHPQSYNTFMHEQLYHAVNISSKNTFIPKGDEVDLSKECKRYNALLQEHGPIDLQLLGIGRNGHVGFNEPNTELEIGTHVVKLKDETINDNSRFFDTDEEVPKYAISVGMKTILTSKKILLLAVGKEKATIVKELLESRITTNIPASLLHLHSDITLICDEAAASLL